MDLMKKKIIFLLIIFSTFSLILSGCVLKVQEEREEAYIERVIDGDTVKTAAGQTIRLLGVDTPEIDWENNEDEFYAEEAKNFTTNNLLEKNVSLEYDQEKEDHYKRSLAYIFKDGENFNLKLLEKGYATLMIVAPNDKYELEFKKAVERARKTELGLWSQILELEEELPIISYHEANQYLGSRVIVKGKILNTAAADSVNYLNFSDDYHSTLSLVIFSKNLNKFAYQPADYFKNENIKALGIIELYQGSPQIIIDDPQKIMIID